jgi:hypothetical protein
MIQVVSGEVRPSVSAAALEPAQMSVQDLGRIW